MTTRDIQLAFPCPHVAVQERADLSPVDRRTLNLRRPLASSGLVRILVNGTLVPPQGVYSVAELTATVSGPFPIPPGSNTIHIETQHAAWDVSLPTGPLVSVRQIHDAILAVVGTDLSVKINSSNRLVFRDEKNLGTSSQILISGSGAPLAGFTLQRGARGQQVIPGWRVQATASGNVSAQNFGEQIRGIRFNAPINGSPLIQVTYSMQPNRCSRCAGALVENDYRFDRQGQVVTVSNENLLVQASQKILLTLAGSNPYHRWYGSSLNQRIGSKAVAGVAAAIKEDVRVALDNFQSVQRQQASFQRLSPEETLASVDSIQVYPLEEDPTAFVVDLTVRNASGNPVQVSIVYTVPGVRATNSNGQSL